MMHKYGGILAKAWECVIVEVPPFRRVLYWPQDTIPPPVFFMHTSIGNVSSVILYFPVIWLRATFLDYPNYCNFTHQYVSECLLNPFIAVGQSSKIS